MQEAFSNLLSNAIKYGPEMGHITIDIIEDNDMWEIRFIDEGREYPMIKEKSYLKDSKEQGHLSV
nr:ATP-binding protein [Methanohalophilus sp. WG1-DM]